MLLVEIVMSSNCSTESHELQQKFSSQNCALRFLYSVSIRIRLQEMCHLQGSYEITRRALYFLQQKPRRLIYKHPRAFIRGRRLFRMIESFPRRLFEARLLFEEIRQLIHVPEKIVTDNKFLMDWKTTLTLKTSKQNVH